MATIVDALIVTLGLDARKFQAGQKQNSADMKKMRAEANATAKELEARGKQAAMFFSKVRNEALTLFAVLAGGMGLKEFVENAVKTNFTLGQTSQNLKMSTRDLVAWGRASERTGGSIEGMTAQLKESQAAVAKWKIGLPDEGTQKFLFFGGDPDALKTANSYLLARFDLINKIFQVDPGRAQLVAQAVGISPDEFNAAKLGRTAFLSLVAVQRKQITLTDKDRLALAGLRNKWLDFKEDVADKLPVILAQHADLINKIIDTLNRWMQWFVDHPKQITEFFKKIADSGGTVKNILLALAGIKLTSLVLQIAGVTGALRSLVFAAGAVAGTWIYDKFIAGTSGGDRLGALEHGDMVGAFGPTVGGALNQLGSHLMGKDRASAASASVISKLVAMGWTPEQASGLAANFSAESGFNPGASGDNGAAYGIGQWHFDRQQAFKRMFGHDIHGSSLDEQLQFANFELTQGNERGAGTRLRGAKSAADAAAVVSRYYERPADADQQAQYRAATAQNLYAGYGAGNALATVGTPRLARAGGGGSMSTSTSKTDVVVQQINVNTQATDAEGIAKSIGPAVQKWGFVGQINSGLS